MKEYILGEKFRAVMATGRVANLPTVWSNVLVGLGLVSFMLTRYLPSSKMLDLGFTSPVLHFIAGSLLYIGGCMLGDYRDLEFDQQNRPNRPLPLGVLTPQFTAGTAYLLLAVGFILSSLLLPISLTINSIIHPDQLGSINIMDATLHYSYRDQVVIALLMTTSIITYATTHKKTGKYALLNMAFCRFFLVSFACLTIPPIVSKTIHFWYSESIIHIFFISLIFAASVGVYTFLLSSVASTESTPEQYRYRKTLSKLLISLPFLSLIIRYIIEQIQPRKITFLTNGSLAELPHISITVVAIIICITWSLYALKALDTSKPLFVSRALAGFCLLDMCFAATFSLPLALICLALFGLALLLQRVAPAT